MPTNATPAVVFPATRRTTLHAHSDEAQIARASPWPVVDPSAMVCLPILSDDGGPRRAARRMIR